MDLRERYTVDELPRLALAVVAYECADGTRRAVGLARTGTPDSVREDALSHVARTHEAAARKVVATDVAREAVPEVEAYLRGIDEGGDLYPGYLPDPRFDDEEDMASARDGIAARMAEALARGDAYRATRSYERDAGANLDIGFLRICERLHDEVTRSLSGRPESFDEAAAIVEAELELRDPQIGRAVRTWKATRPEPARGMRP